MTKDSKFPTEVVELPSKGYFYPEDNPLSSGKVEMKYMTAKEEDILTSPNLIQQNIVIDKLLEALVVDKTINLDDLLIGDKNALILSARILGYGKDYEITYLDDSVEEQTTTIDLTSINEIEMDFSKFQKGVNSFEFELPVSKRNIVFQLMTVKVQKTIEDYVKSISKVKSENQAEITSRLKHLILSVDGKSEKAYINNFVDTEFLAVDSLAFRRHILEISPDIDMTTTVVQPNGAEKEVAVLLTAQFLWPGV